MVNNIGKLGAPKIKPARKFELEKNTQQLGETGMEIIIDTTRKKTKDDLDTILRKRKKARKTDGKENRENTIVAEIIEALASDNTHKAIKLLHKSKIIKIIATNPEIQQFASEAIGRKLSKTGDTGSALGIAKSFNLPEQIIYNGVQKGLAESAFRIFNDKAIDIQKTFNLPIERLKKAAYQQVVTATGSGYGTSSITEEFRKKFQLTEQQFREAVEEGMLKRVSSGDIGNMMRIKDKFNVSNETLETPEFREAAEEGMLKQVSSGDINNMMRIKDKFNVSDETLETPEFREAAEKGMLKRVSSGDIDNMMHIKDKFHVPDETLETPEFREAAEKGMAWKLSFGEINIAVQIKDKLKLGTESISVADKSALRKINTYALIKHASIKYVPYLGKDDLINLFPHTFEKVITSLSMSKEIDNDEDLADYFLENLNKYYSKEWAGKMVERAISHYSVANKFINEVENDQIVWTQQDWVQKVLAQAKITIEKHQPRMEGFLEEDFFNDHPFRTTRSSMGLGRILAEKTTPEESGLNLTTEAIEALQEINSVIVNKYENFLESLKRSPTVPEDDRIALTDQEHSKVKMNNLLPNVRNFIGRYLAQLANGNTEKLNEIIISQKNSIEKVVEEGFRVYLKVYEVDIPLYDKLYEEFDHWREAGRYPMEVYLGRDGIYAYIGRRAQDATRRSKVGRNKREKLHAEGEIIEINPKYLVYPRYFRDDINYATKREFLEQERISPDMDPLFYDTGYTGTIPEQIMHVMGFDQSDIEERIRLLSAHSTKRRVKNIPENARSEIIEYIEHNAKTEETAEGLIHDARTGKIRHVARPTNPEEQFYFMMIKQAIARHYIVQERIHFEAPENANYDSENYYIHIRQEYADMLPKEFIQNPRQFFEQQSTLLKGSKGEGKYPDEEVLSFKLKDGTEIIAKRIEIRKSKEARKEFMILIASKKAGLPTAEPIGFLSGKKEEDGSYLLMGKLEGYSGRKFEKYLKEDGKYTDKQITDIMKTVANKLKDLAQLFRDQLNIDKHWRIKDTIIQFNEKTEEVEGVIPIDWERVKIYDPNKPQKIDLIE